MMSDMKENRRSFHPALLILLVIPLLGVFGALITVARSGGLGSQLATPLPVPTQPTSILIGRTAPNFELETLEGETLRLSSLRGRLVFLNFWATWCEPCRRELPALQTFTEQQAGDGPLVLAINNGETAEQINPFLAENGVSGLTVLLDSGFAVEHQYEVDFFPSTFVVDAGGIVREMHLGELTLDDLNAFVAQYGS